MATPTKFTFKQTLAIPPAESFRLFTHATAWKDWFSEMAQVDARVGGLILIGWGSGHHIAMTILKMEAPSRLVLRWEGRGEPEPTRVTVSIRPKGEGSLVTVTHDGLGSGAKWARMRVKVPAGWTEGLANLKSVAETGVDLRQARRPRLGINIADFHPEVLKQLGVPVAMGIILNGTGEGTGARALGLVKDDVLVRLDGKPAGDFPALHKALEGHSAGDKVRVEWYRGPKKMKGLLELGRFPFPEPPAGPAELAAGLRQHFAETRVAWTKWLEGISEGQAGARPADGWSVKELLAHFILMERDFQSWVADMVNDLATTESLEMRPNVTPRLQALTARFGAAPALLDELVKAQDESVAVLENLPPALVARRHIYRRIAQWVTEVVPMHFHEEHGEQIRAALAAGAQ